MMAEIEKQLLNLHNPGVFSRLFNKNGSGTKSPNIKGLKQLRVLVLQQTFNACKRGYYHLPNRKSVELKLTPPRTISIPFDPQFFETKSENNLNEIVEIWEGDCFDAARLLLDSGYQKVAVLNMASATNPGGGYRSGAGAQEENLHRRTNLYQV
eukprot:c17835_g1_i1.p1 GENE.c17835_g1_i1~~c17835_g1_i1.p1  ORF type:complete len:170 (-),score=54.47 c17835_g1_i1:21-482(-)